MREETQTRSVPMFIQPMEYRAIMAAAVEGAVDAADAVSDVDDLRRRVRELEQELEQHSRNFESALHAARSEAQEAGRTSERTEHSARIAATAQALAAALSDFTVRRDRYLAQVEQEVVKLALAIAARVLHREALMDPLLLAGAVRVALGQLSETSDVRLKVPASEHDLWREMLRLMPNLPLRPEVLADNALTTGDCLLETRLGSVDLGVRSQLAEIERGFFDLLEQREQSDQNNRREPRELDTPVAPPGTQTT